MSRLTSFLIGCLAIFSYGLAHASPTEGIAGPVTGGTTIINSPSAVYNGASYGIVADAGYITDGLVADSGSNLLCINLNGATVTTLVDYLNLSARAFPTISVGAHVAYSDRSPINSKTIGVSTATSTITGLGAGTNAGCAALQDTAPFSTVRGGGNNWGGTAIWWKTDNKNALNAAFLDMATKTNGGELDIPCGVVAYTGPLTIYGNITIKACGLGGGLALIPGSNSDGIKSYNFAANTGTAFAGGTHHVKGKDLVMYGSGQFEAAPTNCKAKGDGTGMGMRLYGAHPEIEGVTFVHWACGGYYIEYGYATGSPQQIDQADFIEANIRRLGAYYNFQVGVVLCGPTDTIVDDLSEAGNVIGVMQLASCPSSVTIHRHHGYIDTWNLYDLNGGVDERDCYLENGAYLHNGSLRDNFIGCKLKSFAPGTGEGVKVDSGRISVFNALAWDKLTCAGTISTGDNLYSSQPAATSGCGSWAPAGFLPYFVPPTSAGQIACSAGTFPFYITYGTCGSGGAVTPTTLTPAADTFTADLNISLYNVTPLVHGAVNNIAVPSNVSSWLGKVMIFEAVQSVSGSDTATFNSAYKWPSGVAPTFSSGASQIDDFSCLIKTASEFHCVKAGTGNFQ